MEIKTFETERKFTDASLSYIESICKKTLPPIHIALSGGDTPFPLYEKISESHILPFEHIEFWEVDERYVPPNHADSNTAMLYTMLIEPLESRLKAFHTFDVHAQFDIATEKYEEELQYYAPEGMDICILGVGRDGHTASLFPHCEALKETEKLTAHTETDEFAIHDRLTLTFQAIMQSKHILILLKGKEKEAVLHEIQNGTKSEEEFPIKRVLSHENVEIHYWQA